MTLLYKKVKLFSFVIGLLISFQNVYSQQGRLPTKQELDTKMALQDLYKNPSFSKAGAPNHIMITGPEQDCDNAIAVCTQSYSQSSSYTGHGTIQEVNGTCLSTQETNSVWYVFTVQNSGTFTFMINTANDYDFALYNITSIGCVGVPSATPIRCNFSATYGSTGLTLPAAGGNLSYNASQAPTMAGINVTAGQTFVLIVDNYSANSNGYTLSFGGSAQIFDNIPPTITNLNYACLASSFNVSFSEPVLCSSIAANGSNFTITGPSGNVPVSSAIGNLCSTGASNTNFATVNFSTAGLQTGTYTISVGSGTSGSIQDKCGNNLPVQTLTFQYLAPITVAVSNPSVCAGVSSTLTVNGTGGASGISYAWSPVAGSASTLVVSPSVNTTYVVTATYGGCTQSASGSVSITLPPVVSVNPANASLCSGTTNILASATSGSSPCLNCTYNWSGTVTQTNVAVPNSTITSAGAGSYSVTVVSNDGCIGNTAVANVAILSPAASPACNIIYASPAGGGTGLTPGSPTDIQTALTMGACNSVVIKMQIGDYTINNPLNMGSFSTIEGGYNVGFTDKTSAKATAGGFPAQGTRIIRSTANVEGGVGFLRYTALNISPSSSYFRIQDVRIDMPDNAVGTSISNYGIYLATGCNNYDITRCYIYSGNAGSGAAGATGATGAVGAVGLVGSNAGVGYSSPMGNSGGGGAGGGASGGAGGAPKIFGGAGAGTVGNNGITNSTAQGGGGGASGGTGGRNAAAAVAGGNGGTGFSGTTGGNGGVGSTINSSSGCGYSATMVGANGNIGANGAAGAPAGTAGVGSDASGYWNAASGTAGAFGLGGRGGGGGGGGATGYNSNTTSGCSGSYGTGGGGGGGGGGGQGGFGGGGGTGGGSTYGIFIFNNGASGNVVDCQIINGLAGAGGAAGAGGVGGIGANGAAGGLGYSTISVNAGAGGAGGKGGNGGAGSAGGAGATGLAATVKVVGGSALAINTTLNMLTQPVITVNNIACTSVPIAHSTAAGAPSWTSFGTGSAPASGAGSPVSTTYSSLGRKTVVMNANNYTDFNNIIVNAPSTGSIVASATSICPGSANFASTAIGTAGLNYSWTVLPAGATISSASTSSTSVLFPNAGATSITYTVTLSMTSNCCGALVPVTTTIVVNPIPVAPSATVNPICIGGIATYSATAPVGDSFSWYNAASSGTLLATGNTYSVANVTTPNTVYLQATNSSGCSSTITPVVVTPTAVPPPTVIPGSACDVGSVQVSITPASGVTDYNWYSDAGGTILVQTGSGLNYSENIATAGGSYIVYVQSTIPGCSPSALVSVSASVSATPITLVQTITPNDTVCFNTPVTFSLNPGGGNGSFAYAWSPVTSTASVLSQTATVSTSYEVIISSNGCSKLFYLPLIVNPTPKDSIGNPLSISCANPTITLDGSFSDTGSNITYSWTTSGGNMLTPTTSNTVIVDAGGNYTLLVTNTITGCSSTQTVAVSGSSTLPTLTLTASSNTLTCSSPTIQLNATTSTSGVTYSWTTIGGALSPTNTANPIATASGTFTVVVTNTATGCQSSQTVVIVPDAAIPTVSVSANSLSITCTNTTVTTVLTSTSTITSYTWSPNPLSGGANPVFDASGTYNATVTASNGCSTNVSVIVALDNLPPVISFSLATNDGTITCTDPSLVVTPSVTPSSNLTYTWTGGSGLSTPSNQASATFTAAGVYTVAITNTLTGCVTSSTNTANTFTVYADQLAPTATISALSTNTVIGCGAGNSTVTLMSAISCTNATIDSWLPSVVSSPTLDVTSAGIYTLVVIDAVNGCSVSTQYTVDGNTNLPQGVSAGASSSVGCDTPTITLTGISTTTNTSFSWTGPSATSIISGSNTATPIITEVGDYTLTVTDNLTGCQSTDTVTITQATITASLTANPTTGTAPLDVAFTGTGTGNPIYSWTFGDGNASNNQNPNNTFASTGTYTVVLTTISGTCIATSTVEIVVENGLTLEIPNVFTPNDDKANDIFSIKSTGIKEISLQVFNRWGQKLFEFTGPKASWDGLTPSGKEVPEGTYFYFVKATGFDDTKIEKHGTVNLFR